LTFRNALSLLTLYEEQHSAKLDMKGQSLIEPLQWCQRSSLALRTRHSLVKNIIKENNVATCVRFSGRSSISSNVLDLAQCFLESW
jgi:hypothetical protein